jgi:hypothetical protein
MSLLVDQLAADVRQQLERVSTIAFADELPE